MTNFYYDLMDYMIGKKCINTHSHHMPNDFFKDINLDGTLRKSYVNWCGVSFNDTKESKKEYLQKVKYKSYFVWLQKAIQEIYGIEEQLTEDNWEFFSNKIKTSHSNENWHNNILNDKCQYSHIIQDSFWNPGSKVGYHDIFTSTFRIDAFLNGYDQDIKDNNDNSFYSLYGKRIDDIDEFTDFLRKTIQIKKQEGCIALKSALAYDRGIDFNEESKFKAQNVLKTKLKSELTKEEIKSFQDYMFFQVCTIAAEFNLPFQCHTGLGKMEKSNALQMREVISKNRDTKFVLFHCGYPWIDDIPGLLHANSNVYPDLCWITLISPTAAIRVLHELIEVGISDRVCWGCDTWTSEESYGALLSLRHVLASTLGEKIEVGYINKNDAMSIIDNIFYNNAKKLYNFNSLEK